MVAKLRDLFLIVSLSVSFPALAGCPQDLAAAQKRYDDAVAAFDSAARECKKVNPTCPYNGPTKSLYEKMMSAGVARGAAGDALEAVKKRCPQSNGQGGGNKGGGRLPGYL